MTEARWIPGTFVWRELMTDDEEAARRFYRELFGWTWKSESMGGAGEYWLASKGERQVGGLMRRPAGMPMSTAWSSYVLVDDVDASTRRCAEAGGRVLRAAADIPGVGRFAVMADPWGAVFQTFRGPPDEAAPPSRRPGEGEFCWETLVTPEPAAAIAFYRKVVGFGTGKTPDGAGTVLTAGETPVADVQQARPGGPAYWATYVDVAKAEDARDRAAALGGTVLLPRIDVPQVGVVAIVADPSGGALGLFQATH